MPNKVVLKRHVDPDIFKAFIKAQGLSIRQIEPYTGVSERTIRRGLQQEEFTLNIALQLCQYFECDFDEIFGPDHSERWRQTATFVLKNVR